jgi:hypothetical protein
MSVAPPSKAEIYKNELNFGHKDTLKWKRFIVSELINAQKTVPISV